MPLQLFTAGNRHSLRRFTDPVGNFLKYCRIIQQKKPAHIADQICIKGRNLVAVLPFHPQGDPVNPWIYDNASVPVAVVSELPEHICKNRKLFRGEIVRLDDCNLIIRFYCFRLLQEQIGSCCRNQYRYQEDGLMIIPEILNFLLHPRIQPVIGVDLYRRSLA